MLCLSIRKFQLDLQLQDENGGDLSSFVTNGEWSLLGKVSFISLIYFISFNISNTTSTWFFFAKETFKILICFRAKCYWDMKPKSQCNENFFKVIKSRTKVLFYRRISFLYIATVLCVFKAFILANHCTKISQMKYEQNV